ncbi:MAG: hypothetical protein KatS3mg102_1955 [Planctomycetota bacterium]|nr:MAG: hypothetical protein KatS3mg102_1955 [Planctomycetota bacterium]
MLPRDAVHAVVLDAGDPASGAGLPATGAARAGESNAVLARAPGGAGSGRTLALGARAEAVRQRARAVAHQAELHAGYQLARGDMASRLGEEALASGRFETALKKFQDARDAYVRALTASLARQRELERRRVREQELAQLAAARRAAERAARREREEPAATGRAQQLGAEAERARLHAHEQHLAPPALGPAESGASGGEVARAGRPAEPEQAPAASAPVRAAVQRPLTPQQARSRLAELRAQLAAAAERLRRQERELAEAARQLGGVRHEPGAPGMTGGLASVSALEAARGELLQARQRVRDRLELIRRYQEDLAIVEQDPLVLRDSLAGGAWLARVAAASAPVEVAAALRAVAAASQQLAGRAPAPAGSPEGGRQVAALAELERRHRQGAPAGLLPPPLGGQPPPVAPELAEERRALQALERRHRAAAAGLGIGTEGGPRPPAAPPGAEQSVAGGRLPGPPARAPLAPARAAEQALVAEAAAALERARYTAAVLEAELVRRAAEGALAQAGQAARGVQAQAGPAPPAGPGSAAVAGAGGQPPAASEVQGALERARRLAAQAQVELARRQAEGVAAQLARRQAERRRAQAEAAVAPAEIAAAVARAERAVLLAEAEWARRQAEQEYRRLAVAGRAEVKRALRGAQELEALVRAAAAHAAARSGLVPPAGGAGRTGGVPRAEAVAALRRALAQQERRRLDALIALEDAQARLFGCLQVRATLERTLHRLEASRRQRPAPIEAARARLAASLEVLGAGSAALGELGERARALRAALAEIRTVRERLVVAGEALDLDAAGARAAAWAREAIAGAPAEVAAVGTLQRAAVAGAAAAAQIEDWLAGVEPEGGAR